MKRYIDFDGLDWYPCAEVDAALAAKDREIAELRVALANLLALVEGECRSIAEDDCNVLAAHDALKGRT